MTTQYDIKSNARVIRTWRYKTGRRGREITTVRVAILSYLVYSHFHLLLHLKKRLAGQKFHKDEEVKNEVTTCSHAQVAEFYDIGIQKTCSQAKQMPWQRWWLCWRVAKRMCYEFFFSLDFVIKYFKKKVLCFHLYFLDTLCTSWR